MAHFKHVMLALLCLTFCGQVWAVEDTWDKLEANKEHQNKMKRETVGDHYRFYIREAMDLACFSYMLNNNQNNSVEFPKYNKAELVFENDIDLSGMDHGGLYVWRGISEGADGDWQGSIDGRGHTIKNMQIANAGSNLSGLIDTWAGEGYVKDLHFVDCHNGCNHENVSILVGKIYKSGTKITVENVSFTNCNSLGPNGSGLVAAALNESAELTIKNVKIKNCHVCAEGKFAGSCIGGISNATITISDVTVDSGTVEANNFAGGIFGKLQDNVKSKIDNVFVGNTTIYGSQYLGGIIGEWQGTGTMTNSKYYKGSYQPGYNGFSDVGGLVGKCYGAHTSVSIDNCVADLSGQKAYIDSKPRYECKSCSYMGGAVGYVSNAAALTMTNVSVLADWYLFTNIPNSTVGLLLGCASKDSHVTIENGHIPEKYTEKTSNIMSAAFGSSALSSSNFIRKTITGLSTLEDNSKALHYIASINLSGSKLGPGYTPLESTEGMVISYTGNGIKTSCEGIDPSKSVYSGTIHMALVGKELTYEFTNISSDQWIVEDHSKGFTSVSRKGATSFVGIPTDDRKSKRSFSAYTVDKPSVSLTKNSFDRNRQVVTLDWEIANADSTNKYWSGDGSWQVIRDGEVIAEKIPYATRTFTDGACSLGQTHKYTINLVSESLCFNGNQTGNFTAEIMCEDDFALNAAVANDYQRKAIKVELPNSQRFNGCSVKLYRFTSEDLEQAEGNVSSLLISENLITSTTYSAQPSSDKYTIPVILYDETNDRPCTMFHYHVVCDDFTDASYEGRKFVSNDAPIKPEQSVRLTSFNASKGESAEQVTITWTSKATKGTGNVTYKVWRKKYDPAQATSASSDDSEGWVVIAEETNTNTSHNVSHKTLPGYVYKYRVRALLGCDGASVSDDLYEDELFDIGYTASRGTIMGSISFSTSNTNVEGVDVRLAPDSLSMTSKGSTSYIRYFSGGNDILPLAPKMGAKFWQGNWTLQFLLRPLGGSGEKNLVSIPGLKDITIKNVTEGSASNSYLCIAGKQMPVSNTNYTRMLISHADGHLKIGYAETPRQTGDNYTNWIIDTVDDDIAEASTLGRDTVFFGATEKMKSFHGLLDEVRLWNIALNDTQVKSTYDRYLTGNESALAAYYTFDSGVIEYAFDESHPDGIWNNHHTKLSVIEEQQVLPSLRSDLSPSEEILCYRGTTDRNGEYQIAGIPFTGEGTNYMVVPIFGTHEFMPSSTRRYVSAQSLTHSSVNFSDISSFPVDIQAYYALGNYPAEGLNVIIDNSLVTNSDGEDVKTDANGRCTVSVPVGKHRLYLRGPQHTMVNDGYPCSITEVSETGTVQFEPLQDKDHLIDFQASPVAPLTFYDNTYARVAGRVVGGNVESSKPLGANLSHANLGQVEITLEPSMRSGYHLNNQETADIKLNGAFIGGAEYNDSINSTTTYLRSSSDIVIRTDSLSGEFLAYIPPVSMRIKDIHTTGSYGKLIWDDFNTGNQSDLITIDMTNENQDSINVDAKGNALPEEAKRTFMYHVKKNYTYFVDPEISVVNPANINGKYPQMLGDSIWVNRYTELNGNEEVEIEDIVNLWHTSIRDGSPDSYMLNGMPVFTMGNEYSFDISLFERYHNCDTGKDALYHIPDVALNIINGFATQKAEVKETNGTMEYTLAPEEGGTDIKGSADGKTRYTFSAGFPNPLAPHTLDMTISYTTNGKVYTYPEEGSIKGIVMGHVNVPGTDFVTAGPNHVAFVLRDPPGGSSYSWIEQGTTISSSASYENLGVGSQDVNTVAVTFTGREEFSGTITGGVEGVISLHTTAEKSTYTDRELGVSTSWTAGNNRSANLSYTLTERLQTNSSQSYVGSQGDIYVGSATNFIFSKSQILGLRKSPAGTIHGTKNTYSLEQYDGISQTVDYPTTFKYTQRHILDELIPGWRKVRRSCVDEVVSSLKGLPRRVPGDKPRYYVLSTTSDKKDVWKQGEDYACVYPEQGNHSDTISIINNYIIGWQDAIRSNERTKVNTMKSRSIERYTQTADFITSGLINPEPITIEYGYIGNTSFDAGVSNTKTMTRDEGNTNGSVDAGTMQGVYNDKVKWKTNFIAAGKEFRSELKFKEGYSRKDSESHTTSNKQTFGYTLSDSKPGSYYSVDVWLPGEMDGRGKLVEVKNGGKPKFDEFFVFRLAGGQSKCPYEPEEYTLYYKENNENVKIGDGTIAIEEPKISIAQHVFTDIPNGQKFSFPITLSNASVATVKLACAFTLNINGLTNPDGLKFSIDGVPLLPANGFEVLLLPGQSMQKMVEISQTRTDITHYENIAFRFASSGEPGRAFSDSVSFHFKPASSPVTMKMSSNVVNSLTPETAATLTVSDYQPDFEDFTGIRIQYKTPTEMNWHTATVLVNDSTKLADLYGEENFPEVWQYLDRKADYTRFTVPLGRLADGEYLFRAQSFSPVGKADEVTTESEVLTIIKDTSAPTLLTHPDPITGIYNGTLDIGIEMNEAIDMALLTPDNFSVTGVLNDAEVRHMSGLHFDGNAPAHTQSRVNIFGNSSVIALWYKPQVGKTSCLLSQNVTLLNGTPAKLALFYNEDASLTLQLGDNIYKSTRRAIDTDGRAIDDWMYASLIINREANETNLFNLFGTSTQAESHFLKIPEANVSADCNVPLYVGGSASGDECYADMEELVLYEGAQEFATIAANKGNRHYDHLNELLGYWPMDEGQDMTAADKVRSRNLILQGTDNWYSPVTNYAVHFNGNKQFVRINTEKCSISRKQNYILEFHFRTDSDAPTATQTLFSNGWGGQGSTEASLLERLSISLDRTGKILFEAAGKTYTLGENYADRNWHHLILDVERCGYARIYVDEKDISGITNIAGSDLGGLANAKMTLGAMIYSVEGVNDSINFFAGDIDEFRLWNAHGSDDIIKTMAYSRLTGSEVGLVAYYPFEHTKIVSNHPVTEPWISDCVVADESLGILPADDPVLFGDPVITDNGPRIKAAGIPQPVAIEYTHNGKDRIVFNFPADIDKRRIEGCTLIFSVKNLQDMAGNKMLQPAVWNVYVQQKSIEAWTSATDIYQQIGESKEAMLSLYNRKSTSQRWTLSGLPEWLSAEKTNGTIEPFSVQTINLQTSDATAVGNYMATLLVEGEDHLASYMTINLHVTSISPDWYPEDTDGSVWMSILGKLKVDGAWSTDESDLVAAFTNDGRCLGLASPEYNENMNAYFLHMNIKGNYCDEGEELHFVVWDASTGITYTDTELQYMLSGTETKGSNIKLQSTKILGNFTYPCSIMTTDVIRQTMSLHPGWNWISFWVDPKVGKNAADIFSPVRDNIVEVKARTKGYTPKKLRYLDISLASSYQVYADDYVTFSIEGTRVNPADVSMVFIHPTEKGGTRWQWIGFPLHSTQTLATAFADFHPSTDDVVKAEDSYAMFNGYSWIGNLKYLSPGKGYLYGYHSDDSRDIVWTYPAKAKGVGGGYALDVDPYDYENYTFVTITVEGLSFADGRYQLAAIDSKNHVHGIADNEGNTFYLCIYGNEGERYSFQLYDRETGYTTAINSSKKFDAVTPSQTMNLRTATDIILPTVNGSDSWYDTNGIYMGTKKPDAQGIFIKNRKKQINK